MFYNILLSKPFAEHHGLKTQDRSRPITPLIADYTRKSISAFISKYPNVGLLVCLGEAMNTHEDDVEWFTKTILPGVRDGWTAWASKRKCPSSSGRTIPTVKWSWTRPCPVQAIVHHEQVQRGIPGDLRTGGPWGATHKALSQLGTTHIANVHILANLEPFRWTSPDFIQRSVKAMHAVHGANALHLYPQASYWDWPYTADKVDGRLLQIDRDKLWYQAWARYAWEPTGTGQGSKPIGLLNLMPGTVVVIKRANY
jgi:hypothetical protein